MIIQNGNATTGETLMADPDLLQILQLPMVKGDRATVLKDLYGLVHQRERGKAPLWQR